MKPKKHLCFDALRKVLSHLFRQLPDERKKNKIDYSIHDIMMSGFACMFFQDPSLLQFQQQLKDERHRDNLQTLFDVEVIPRETQMREIIDDFDSVLLRPVFKNYFLRLQRGKYLEQYQFLPGQYYCPIDGVQFYSSGKIKCDACLTANHKNGHTTYSHKALQAAIVHPDMRQVIPLMPEEVRNTDGTEKQDCETKAAKRLIPKIREDHPQLELIIGGDDLFSKQPFIETVLNERMHYLLVAKETTHTVMITAIDKSGRLKKTHYTDKKDRTHVYEWIEDIPLNGNENPIITNFFRYTILGIDKDGNPKINYKNSWVSDLSLSPKHLKHIALRDQDKTPNDQQQPTLAEHTEPPAHKEEPAFEKPQPSGSERVKHLVRGGRSRWKIENECFNTLKNQGYHISHNFGHGKKHLCFNFYLFTLLAFFFHQIFELTDRFYQACRKKFGSKCHMWETLRSYVKILIFEDWEHLLDFALDPLKYNPNLGQPP